MNHNAHSVIVPVEKEYTEMITGEKVKGTVSLGAYDVAVLK